MPDNFVKLARSAICEIESEMEAPVSTLSMGCSGIPEVAHTEAGDTLLRNFLKICDRVVARFWVPEKSMRMACLGQLPMQFVHPRQ